jgi:hypothetical protein
VPHHRCQIRNPARRDKDELARPCDTGGRAGIADPVQCVWLDGVAPDEIAKNRSGGITGATSNPVIVSNIVERGQFDRRTVELLRQGLSDEDVAWQLNDELVKSAQDVFLPVWKETGGNDGYVSFELDPLIEDDAAGLDHAARVERYVELGERWSAEHGKFIDPQNELIALVTEKRARL